ncbi:unnamed protein product, partial [Hapterophycus canaliculatus]
MPGYEDRARILEGVEDTIFKLVCDRATPGQWAEWLRVPLEHAAGTGDQHLMDKLLRAGANGRAGWRGCHGKTLLHAGVEGGNENVVATLLRTAGKEVNTMVRVTGYTPLHQAVLDGKETIAKMLLMVRADVNVLGGKADGVLHLAIERGHVELAEMMLLRGADPNVRGHDGSFPMHLAIRRGQNGLIRSLIQTGAKLNTVDAQNMTCLATAVYHERVSTVKVLLAGGADLKFANAMDIGKTVLHLAAEFDKTAAIPVLVKAGADVNR